MQCIAESRIAALRCWLETVPIVGDNDGDRGGTAGSYPPSSEGWDMSRLSILKYRHNNQVSSTEFVVSEDGLLTLLDLQHGDVRCHSDVPWRKLHWSGCSVSHAIFDLRCVAGVIEDMLNTEEFLCLGHDDRSLTVDSRLLYNAMPETRTEVLDSRHSESDCDCLHSSAKLLSDEIKDTLSEFSFLLLH